MDVGDTPHPETQTAARSLYAFQFTLTVNEVRQYVRRFTRASVWWVRVMLIVLALPAATLSAMPWVDAITNPIHRPDFIFGIVSALLGVGLVLWFLFASQVQVRIVMHRLRRANTDLFDNQELRFTPTGMESVSRRTRSTLNWSAICDVVRGDDAIYFMLDKKVGYILPRRVFDDSGENVERFLEDIAKWRRHSPPYERQCPECRYDFRGQNEAGCPECGWRRETISAPELGDRGRSSAQESR